MLRVLFHFLLQSLIAFWFRSELEVDSTVTAEMFPGFSAMSKEDQSMLKEKLGSSKTSEKKTAKKRKNAPEEKAKASKKLKEEVKEKTEEEKKEEDDLKVIFICWHVCIVVQLWGLFCQILRIIWSLQWSKKNIYIESLSWHNHNNSQLL